MTRHRFQLDKEFIELHALLKLLAIASSGGAAKALIATGRVSVDGAIETRKACKIRGNQVVRVDAEEIHLVAATKEEGGAGGTPATTSGNSPGST